MLYYMLFVFKKIISLSILIKWGKIEEHALRKLSQSIGFSFAGTIEQGDWKRTDDHYCIIIYEHTLLVAGVLLFKELKTIMFQLSKQDQN